VKYSFVSEKDRRIARDYGFRTNLCNGFDNVQFIANNDHVGRILKVQVRLFVSGG
jgi:hypothetical protein